MDLARCAPVIITGALVTLWYVDVDLGPGGNQLVLGARNLAVMVIVVVYLVAARGPGVPEVASHDGTRLHVEVEGEGEPVTVFAHGLTNSCHGAGGVHADGARHEGSVLLPRARALRARPEPGHYRFADFADDLDAVATAYGATRAVGTSLGRRRDHAPAGREPDRFERIVFVLPAALDLRARRAGAVRRCGRPARDAAGRRGDRARSWPTPSARPSTTTKPWLRELDLFLWQDLNAVGVARAIREMTRDVAIADRELLRAVPRRRSSSARRATRSIPSSSPGSWPTSCRTRS